ncbi:hypothetical protein [Ottowia thiooxydans]|uniref:hypothetical protein n=1 Tax=Ottowia thiooxydans TaxID=219182 RepID=UPI00040658E5|nr:hypothetical protein [Ottowia thiooxydans]
MAQVDDNLDRGNATLSRASTRLVAQVSRLPNDELFVVDITGKEAAWSGLDKRSTDWLSSELNL